MIKKGFAGYSGTLSPVGLTEMFEFGQWMKWTTRITPVWANWL